MGWADKLKKLSDTATELVGEHKEQIQGAVDKVQKAADERTGGKYHDKLAQAGAKTGDLLDKVKPDEPAPPAAPAATPPAGETPPTPSA